MASPKHWLWTDKEGHIHVVVKTGEPVPAYYNGYVHVKTVDEQRYHTAITRDIELVPAGNNIH